MAKKSKKRLSTNAALEALLGQKAARRLRKLAVKIANEDRVKNDRKAKRRAKKKKQ
jgi:hypothetical protein